MVKEVVCSEGRHGVGGEAGVRPMAPGGQKGSGNRVEFSTSTIFV